MSREIQTALRRLIPFAYFQSVENYRGLTKKAAALLVYKSMPVSTSIELTSSGPLFNRNKKVYWDYLAPDLLDAVVRSPQTQTKLSTEMSRVARMLSQTEGVRGQAGFYAESELGEVLGAALNDEGEHLLRNALLRTESIVINSAVSAGHQMARFVKFGGEDPEKALEALAKFGAGITSTFNGKLGGLFNPKDNKQLLRNLGLQVFLEATRVLGSGLADVQPTAMLDVRVLRGSEDFPPAGYIDQGLLGGDVKVGVAQRVIGAAA